MTDKLAIPADEFRAMGRAVLERITSYYEGLPTRAVVEPSTSQAIRALLEEPLPREGSSFEVLLDTFDEVIARYSRHNGHPRFFGYVSSPGTAVTTLGSMLKDAVNANLTCWRSAPAGTELEHITISWLKEMLGLAPDADGLFTSGGSMANFSALAAARSAKAPGNVIRDGVAGPRMCAYVSKEAHFSVRKAAGLLGLGEANVGAIETNSALEIDVADLERRIQQDQADGHLPFCVVANAGTTATGAFDPIGAVADVARRYGLWLHVDAAYGGFAALAPSARQLFARIDEADSVALDPHKWLFLPVGCGCVLYRDAENARAAFSHDAEYTRRIGFERDEAFAFWDYGPELSRPFRALDLWLLIKYVGAARLAEAVEENIACAKYLEKLVQASDDFEMLMPVVLSIFCFRYAPKGFGGDLNVLNERLMAALQRGGSTYLSNAEIEGKFALRGCVLNYRTTRRDMEIVLEDVRRAYQNL